MADRTGKRKTREQLLERRIPELGYYYIITDTEETEQNYMLGLRDSIPKKLQGKLVIKVSRIKSIKLIDEAIDLSSLHPQYSEPWIVFDRDQIKDFDKIISLAKEKGIKVGWSNPCIEIWFHAYFGEMPSKIESVACCDSFKRKYFKKTKQKYEKSDPAIYNKLCCYGNEREAINIAFKRHKIYCINEMVKPSRMHACTTLYLLVDEIKQKSDR